MSELSKKEHPKSIQVDVESVTESDIEELTQEGSLMDLGTLISGDERSAEDNPHPWVVSGSKRKTKK